MKAIAHFFIHFLDFNACYQTDDEMIFGAKHNAEAHAQNLDSKKRNVKEYTRDSAEVKKAIADYQAELKAAEKAQQAAAEKAAAEEADAEKAAAEKAAAEKAAAEADKKKKD